LKSLGFNTLRIYAWSNTIDHTPFLDACHAFGLKVMVTHYVGTAEENPISTTEERQAVVDAFVAHVRLLGDHPAILMWSFGNELNGAWNMFQKAWSDAGKCDWQSFCYNVVDRKNACFDQTTCMYNGFFPWIESALAAAKVYTTRPLTSTFADVDVLVGTDASVDKIPRFEKLAPSMDVWTLQLYRGKSIAGFLQQYAKESSRPLLVGEYGVDAMNDNCGWPENKDDMSPCFQWSPGSNGQPGGSDVDSFGGGCTGKNANEGCNQPGVTVQTQWDTALTKEIEASSTAIGGILMEWHDEYWKNIGTQDKCDEPCPEGKDAECADPSSALHKALLSSSAGCTYKAHVSCPNHNTLLHDVCGYFLESAPDGYVNEAWFGLHATEDCGVSTAKGQRLTALRARPVTVAIASLFSGPNDAQPRSCDQMKPCWSCTTTNADKDIMAGKCDSVCGVNFATMEQGSAGNGQGVGGGAGATGNGDGDLATTSAAPSTVTSSSIAILLALLLAALRA